MVAVVLSFGFVLLGAQSAVAEPQATALVDSMFRAMGGVETWEDTRYLRFDWVVERGGEEVARVRHLWDRHDGRYRVEWSTREGQDVRSILDLETRAGQVWVDGSSVADPERDQYLETAYARYINDAYWLLMPWKLRDPGVQLTLDSGDDESALLHVVFEGVGLTPGDQYWVFVDPKTHLVQRWAYFLEDQEGEASRERATAWQWDDWEWVGGVRFARDRRKLGKDEDTRIWFPVLRVFETLDDRVFESIEWELP